MQCQKSQITTPHGGRFNREVKLFGLSLALMFLPSLIFGNTAFALYTPTLSTSIGNTAASVNGNQVINSANKTTEIPLNITVNTNNETGYTVTLSSETDETSLVNSDSTNGAKINSISSAGLLEDFSNNTWGVKVGNDTNFSPIPKLTSPMNAIQTTGKTNGNEVNSIKIGMKLSDNLVSGRYTNKLVFSIFTNNYNYTAVMIKGTDFNTKLKSLETATNKIEHFKKSAVAPAASVNAINIEDEESDCEIKLWLDPTGKTAYYYTEAEKVRLNKDARSMFSGMSSLTTLDLSSFDTSRVTSMRFMFSGMSNLTTLNLSSFDTSQVTDMYAMFQGMSNLAILDLSSFNTSKVTNMESMFSGMPNLTTLNLSNFDTSRVTNMYAMFQRMSNLTTLNLSSFDTSKVISMGSMFAGMPSLTNLDLSSFDTSKVTNMTAMFSNMSSLTALALFNFDTSRVTNMGGMFSNMSSLTALDLSSFDISKVTDMRFMFSGMSNLTTLDLSNFNTSKVTNMESMFSLLDRDKLMDRLEKIYVNNDFDTTKLTNFYKMFENRKKLRGGNGSYLANPSTADKTWLRVDRPGVQGYFTRKP